MANIIIQTQGKGGVGKSTLSSYLAQYLIDDGKKLFIYDADTVNPTLSSFKTLGAIPVKLGERADEINQRYFDALIEGILNYAEDDFVLIDIGASTFLPLLAYMKENDVLSFLGENGHSVRLQTILKGGQDLNETMQNFLLILETFPKQKIDIWLNEYFAPVKTADGTEFDKSKFFEKNKAQIGALIKIPSVNQSTFGFDINKMLTDKKTFSECLDDKNINIMARQRLKNYRDIIFQSIQLGGF